MNTSLQTRLDSGKLYHSISEVCRMTGLEPHVLRYWETEFSQMRPKKNRAGNRAYRSKEIQYIRYIQFLLHDEKYTIQGAKKRLNEVGPEEIAGQVSLIRPHMLAAPPQPIVATVIPPIETPSAQANESKQQVLAEIKSIKAELEAVLRLLDGNG